MKIVNVHQARSYLSRLLTRLVAGKRPSKREPDVFKGKIVVPEDFLEPLPEEELRRWEGS